MKLPLIERLKIFNKVSEPQLIYCSFNGEEIPTCENPINEIIVEDEDLSQFEEKSAMSKDYAKV